MDKEDISRIMKEYVLPIIVANIIFIVLGYLFILIIPAVKILDYWFTLLLGGNVGVMIMIMLSTNFFSSGEKYDFKGILRSVLISDGSIYVVEFIWFLVVDLRMTGSIGLVILTQFIGQYCTAIVVNAVIFNTKTKSG